MLEPFRPAPVQQAQEGLERLSLEEDSEDDGQIIS